MSDTADDDEEEMKLEAELRAMTEEKKAVFETTREPDERLRKIREEERQKQERLHQIRRDRVEREQRERHAATLEAQKKCTKHEADLRAEFEAMKIENDQLKRQVAALGKDGNERTSVPRRGSELDELEQLRRKNAEQKEAMEKMKESMKSVTKYSKTQQKEKREKEEENVKLTRRVKCLEDEIAAARQIAVETQLRQLNELQSLTEETRELKKTLTELHQQQQQQPAAQEHHQGNYLIICSS